MHVTHRAPINVVGLVLCATALHACGGSSGGAGADTEVDASIRGNLNDGPVVGAQVTVRTRSGGVLQNGVSDQRADYAIAVKTASTSYPLLFEATAGTDIVTNLPPDFTLASAVLEPRSTIANLNPFTTLAIATARQMPSGITTANIETALENVMLQFDTGLVSLAIGGPMSTPIEDSNVAEMVKTSEALAEIFRRVQSTMRSAGRTYSVDEVIERLGADLIDGKVDGHGGPMTDRQTSAAAMVVSAQVLMETMTNSLHVNGQPATAALDKAVNRLRSQPTSTPTASVPVTAGIIYGVRDGIAAAASIAPSDELTALEQTLKTFAPGMRPSAAAEALPADGDAFVPALRLVTAGAARDVDTLVATGTNSSRPLGPGTVTLSWMPPTANADGSPLIDLAGYRVRWGRESRRYTGSAMIDNPGITRFVVEGLASGQHYFAITALNAKDVESEHSNEATARVP
jgi:hypothetical protein